MYFCCSETSCMSSNKPLILITNDDGITAPGIRTLIEVMNSLGEVYVVAPQLPSEWNGSCHYRK